MGSRKGFHNLTVTKNNGRYGDVSSSQSVLHYEGHRERSDTCVWNGI
jgi:hypothetical protein